MEPKSDCPLPEAILFRSSLSADICMQRELDLHLLCELRLAQDLVRSTSHEKQSSLALTLEQPHTKSLACADACFCSSHGQGQMLVRRLRLSVTSIYPPLLLYRILHVGQGWLYHIMPPEEFIDVSVQPVHVLATQQVVQLQWAQAGLSGTCTSQVSFSMSTDDLLSCKGDKLLVLTPCRAMDRLQAC